MAGTRHTVRQSTLLVALAAVLIVCIAGAVWWFRGGATARETSGTSGDERRAILPAGAPSDFLTPRAVGNPIRENERPLISNVQIVDLDGDGLADILACDTILNRIVWIRQLPKGVYTESAVGDTVAAPAHVEAVDVDGDGDLDLVVAGLGVLSPSDNRIGTVVILENDGSQHFTNHVVADHVARVADARVGDLDGDGDLDIAVAGFGYDSGDTSWLENKGGWTFEQHVLLRLSGPINAIVADVNRDGHPDIVALVSQEWEEIWAFINDGRGNFMPRMIWGSTNSDFGSSWMTMVDLDRDGDPDILYANGDAFEYAPPNSRPWQGVQWLENRGDLKFEFHRMIDQQGVTSPEAVDIDGDGDLDVLLVNANNDWDNPAAPSLLWLENDGKMQFTMHPIASTPTHLLTLSVGDLDGDGKPDAVTGGMHISRPYDRIGRITGWFRNP